MNESAASGNLESSAQKPHGGDSIFFGPIPPEPTQEALDGIRFDFNDGARVKFPKGVRFYLAWILPVIILFVFSQGYIQKFF